MEQNQLQNLREKLMESTYPTRTIEYFMRVFDEKKPTVSLSKNQVLKSAPAHYKIEQSFPRVKPEAVGIPSETIYNFLRDLKDDKTLNMHSVMIIRDGKVICEAAFGPYSFDLPRYTFSACKSVTSLAIGLLIDEGKLSIKDKVVDIFPEVNLAQKLAYSKLTVEDLLTMKSGSLFNEVGAIVEDDWEKEFFTVFTTGIAEKPFYYNSLNTYMLASIVKRKSGTGLVDYLTPRLFAPLGIKGAHWEKSPSGVERGGWGLYICPEDSGKLAQLILNRGMWNGVRIISEKYLESATEAHVTAPSTYGEFNYGYQIWVGRSTDSFLFNGMFGQNTLAFRNNNIILVSNAGNNELFQQSSYYGYAIKYFSEIEPSSSAAVSPEKEKTLAEYIRYLANPYRAKRGIIKTLRDRAELSKKLKELDGKTYVPSGASPVMSFMPMTIQVAGNYYARGLDFVDFKKSEGKLCVVFTENGEIFTMPVDFEGYATGDIRIGANVYEVASHGKFMKNGAGQDVLSVKVYFTETPCTRVIRFTFAGNSLGVSIVETPGVAFVRSSFAAVITELLTKKIFALMKISPELSDTGYIIKKAESILSPKAKFNLK